MESDFAMYGRKLFDGTRQPVSRTMRSGSHYGQGRLHFRMGFRQVSKIIEENDEAQIDLMDSIKEVSLVEKHQLSPLSSVGEGLTILERANYTSTLFSNDEVKFNDMLDAVDGCGTVNQAVDLFRNSISPSGRKEEVALAMESFEKRIPRIFFS